MDVLSSKGPRVGLRRRVRSLAPDRPCVPSDYRAVTETPSWRACFSRTGDRTEARMSGPRTPVAFPPGPPKSLLSLMEWVRPPARKRCYVSVGLPELPTGGRNPGGRRRQDPHGARHHGAAVPAVEPLVRDPEELAAPLAFA